MYQKTTLDSDQVREIIFDIIDRVMDKGNASVSVTFANDGGVFVNAYPVGPDEEADADV